VSSSRVLTCRCGFRQVWLSVSRASWCVGLGLSRVIGDQMFCTTVDASMTLASCDGVRTVTRAVWLAYSTVYHFAPVGWCSATV
jgi:hypothetical protein